VNFLKDFFVYMLSLQNGFKNYKKETKSFIFIFFKKKKF